jgi:N-acetylglucosaminyldiphosphoundecaprenol N-acetyl-beta-D-mannosaminyltransferase
VTDAVRRPSFVTGGVRVDAISLEEAVATLLTAPGPLTVHLCNAYTVALASRDDTYRQTLDRGGLNLADGMPLVWIARRLGFTLDRRVYGPDLMTSVLERGQPNGLRHFLYGTTVEGLADLQQTIRKRWPAASVVGAIAPPFGAIDDGELQQSLAVIEQARADIVWVAIGTPRQDDMVERMAAMAPGTYVAIGAAFDFIAGTKRQAPGWMQRAGLEWLFRLATEPRRLWRRYLLGNSRFVWVNLRHRPSRR